MVGICASSVSPNVAPVSTVRLSRPTPSSRTVIALLRTGNRKRDREHRVLPGRDGHVATHRFESLPLQRHGVVAGRKAQEVEIASPVAGRRLSGARPGRASPSRPRGRSPADPERCRRGFPSPRRLDPGPWPGSAMPPPSPPRGTSRTSRFLRRVAGSLPHRKPSKAAGPITAGRLPSRSWVQSPPVTVLKTDASVEAYRMFGLSRSSARPFTSNSSRHEPGLASVGALEHAVPGSDVQNVVVSGVNLHAGGLRQSVPRTSGRTNRLRRCS